MTESIYPITETVEYQDDDTYRDTLMRIVLLVNGPGAPGVDDDTKNEAVFEHFLDRLFDATDYNTILHKFYIDAAGFMLSEDPGIGLAVLCSYDYFALFHVVLCDYFAEGDHPPAITETTPSVVNLRKKMTR